MSGGTDFLHDDLELARRLALEAGRLAMRHLAGPLHVRDKGGRRGSNPVTGADLAVDALLRVQLGSARPSYGWLSEETADDSSRFGSERIWMVDPIDGTRAMVEELDEFVVSIGLLEAGEPVLGVIHHPPSATSWWGTNEGGAFRAVAGEAPTRLTTSSTTELTDAVVAIGRSEAQRPAYAAFEAEGAQIHRTHSAAYKLALVAAGDAHIYPCARRLADWDIAAGVAIVRAAGGLATRTTGEPLEWNQATPYNPGILAAANEAMLAAAIAALASGVDAV